MKEENSLSCINEHQLLCGIPPTPSYTGVASLLKILTKTMELQGAYISTIAEVQYSVCKQAGIDIPEEFITDTLGALTRSHYKKAMRYNAGEEKRRAKDKIIEFLKESGGQATPKDIERHLLMNDISSRSMKSAKAELVTEGVIKYIRKGFHGEWSVVLVKEDIYETV